MVLWSLEIRWEGRQWRLRWIGMLSSWCFCSLWFYSEGRRHLSCISCFCSLWFYSEGRRHLSCISSKDTSISTCYWFRAVFNWVLKVISRLLWFCIATLYDWLKNLAPLFQPIRSKTKTNTDCELLACIFPRLAPAACICLEIWLVHWIVCLCCDWSELWLWFWFYDTQVKTTLFPSWIGNE